MHDQGHTVSLLSRVIGSDKWLLMWCIPSIVMRTVRDRQFVEVPNFSNSLDFGCDKGAFLPDDRVTLCLLQKLDNGNFRYA